MINNCEYCDIDRINELGSLINDNFSRVNNIKEIIKNNEIKGYYKDNKLLGFILFKKLYEVVDLLYIVVDPIHRRQGIGSKLMDTLINLEYEKIMLEVNEINENAINLYKKYNFKIINIRSNYYGNNNAYVMELIK